MRPGRVDVAVRVGEATRYQAAAMWDRFYGDVDADGSARERFLARLDELGLFASEEGAGTSTSPQAERVGDGGGGGTAGCSQRLLQPVDAKNGARR